MSAYGHNEWGVDAKISISSDPSNPTQLTYSWLSFDQTTTYQMIAAGSIDCPSISGNVGFDIFMNGVKIKPTRYIQSTANGSESIGELWPLTCKDCVTTTDENGNTNYNNTITFQFLWNTLGSNTTPAHPTVSCMNFCVIAVA